MRAFVLQAIDPETGCPAVEARLAVDDLSALRAILGSEAEEGRDLRYGYSLDPEQLAAIARTFGLAFDPEGRPATIVPWHPIRKVPYLVHTGFELALMLEERKPLAVFSDAFPSELLDELVGRFDPYVASGRFVRRIVDRPLPEPRRSPNGSRAKRVREVYVALPGEAWRIDAFLLLREVGAKAGWNDALERFEGTLLGYEEWQNDWWQQNRQHLRGEP
jgi:hypothetical protein